MGWNLTTDYPAVGSVNLVGGRQDKRVDLQRFEAIHWQHFPEDQDAPVRPLLGRGRQFLSLNRPAREAEKKSGERGERRVPKDLQKTGLRSLIWSFSNI